MKLGGWVQEWTEHVKSADSSAKCLSYSSKQDSRSDGKISRSVVRVGKQASRTLSEANCAFEVMELVTNSLIQDKMWPDSPLVKGNIENTSKKLMTLNNSLCLHCDSSEEGISAALPKRQWGKLSITVHGSRTAPKYNSPFLKVRAFSSEGGNLLKILRTYLLWSLLFIQSIMY